MSLVPGVAALTAVLVAVGYALLAPSLRAAPYTTWLSYLGVALLTGAAATTVVLCNVAVAGFTVGLIAFLVVAAVLATAGVASALLLPPARLAAFAPPAAPRDAATGRLRDAVAAASAGALASLAVLALVGGFRSSPWLDDVWAFWLAKGVNLDRLGLDERLWTLNTDYVGLTVPDYPFAWSILTNLDMRFVGTIDMRAINAQLTILAIGFVGAVARLLWGHVRPWLLWPSLLLLFAMPEFVRHLQGGVADMPLALFVGAAVVCGGLWLVTRAPFVLVLAALFSAGAMATKNEAFPDLALAWVALTIAAWGIGRRRLALLWAAPAAALATSLPWFGWKAVHGVQLQIRLGDLFDPGYLADNTAALRYGADVMLGHWTSAREWLLVLPLFAALGVLGLALDSRRGRRRIWIAPPLFVTGGYLLLVWIFWADRIADFRLVASAYRLVDPFAVVAAVGIGVAAELLARMRSAA